MRKHLPLLSALVIIIALLAHAPAAQAGDRVFNPWQNDFTPPAGAATAPEGSGHGSGPWITRVMLATSPDGLTFTRTGEVVADQAGVPAVVVDHDGYVRVYYQAWNNNGPGNPGDFPAFAIRDTEGNWFHHKVEMDQWTDKAVDAYVVKLADGGYRLYFMEDIGGFKLRICSGVSADGKYFTRDEGFRLDPGNETVFDPMVLPMGDQYLLVAGPDGSYSATSQNGLDFVRQGPFVVQQRRFMAWSGVAMAQGGYRLYGNFQGDGKLTSLYSADGQSWSEEPGWRIDQQPLFDAEGSGPMPDNGAAQLADGSFLLAYLVRIPEQ